MIKSKYINDILDLLLDGDDEGISAKKQLEYISEEKFDYTGSGVFVKFSHTEKAKDFKTDKLDLVLNGVTILTSEYAIECDAILFFSEGIIDYLEIWCYNGEDYPKKDLVKYTLTQTWINSPEKTISTETATMNKRISKIPNDVQDRNSVAWEKLCEYIDQVAENGIDEFVPREALGDELFAQIFTLPESIAKLKKVKKIGLYGSNLKRIPPEIGQMESLEFFDPYTSYDLHWFPFEIYKCKKLKDSRISTRALYGNYKNRMGFPKLDPTRPRLPSYLVLVCNEYLCKLKNKS